MKNKVNLTKSTLTLFICNVVAILLTIFFANYFLKREYLPILIIVELILNVLLIILGIIYNVIFIKNDNKYDDKKSIVIVITLFLIFILYNTFGMYYINSLLNSKYSSMNKKIASYCDTFGCDKYETKVKNGYKQFIIKKEYFDYDNNPNSLVIITNYDDEKVLYVKASVYSSKNMFSESLISDNVKKYFYNFDYNVKEELIKDAFDKRFDGKVSDGNATYKVEEIYEKNELVRLKTNIILDLKQD